MKLTLKYIIFSFSALILFGCAVKTTKNVINIVGQIGSIDEYGNVVLDKKSSAQAKAYLELGDSLNIHLMNHPIVSRLWLVPSFSCQAQRFHIHLWIQFGQRY